MSEYFNPIDFFDLAKKLDSCNTESANRTILNRCYYSCYLRIKDEFYGNNRKSLADYIPHDSAFYMINRKDKKLGGYINRLYVARLVSDYSLNSDETHELYRRRSKNSLREPWGEFNVDISVTKESLSNAKRFHDSMDEKANKN